MATMIDTCMSWTRRMCAIAFAIVFGMAALMAAMPAYADAGGGGVGGGNGGGTQNERYGFWWHDRGSFLPTGEFQPEGGWDEESIAHARAMTQTQTGFIISESHVTYDPVKGWPGYLSRACDKALDNARARGGSPHARIVGMGYAYFNASPNYIRFFWRDHHTFETLIKNPGNAYELPDAIGWGATHPASGKNWRQHAYDQARADVMGDPSLGEDANKLRVVAVAVNDREPVAQATLEVKKVSDSPDLVEGNLNYSVAGAVYGIFSDPLCGEDSLVQRVTTGDGGVVSVKLPAHRTYYLKELEAPRGYKLNPNVSQVTLDIGAHVTSVQKDIPEVTAFSMFKTMSGQAQGETIGDIDLSGAVCEVKFFADGIVDVTPTRRWFVTSDDRGHFDMADEASFATGSDPLPRDSKGAIAFPMGTYTVQEIKAPNGLLLEGQTNAADTSYKAPVHTYVNKVIIDLDIDNPLRVYTATITKLDSDLGIKPQGDADLEGATFSLYNASKSSVLWRGRMWAPNALMADDLRVRKDAASGRYIVIVDDLPYGTYRVKETISGHGYTKPDPSISHELGIG